MGKIINLAEVAEVSKLSKEERIKYDHALKRYRDTLNAMAGAEQKGREDAKRDNARRMKADNMPVELIAKYQNVLSGVDSISRIYRI